MSFILTLNRLDALINRVERLIAAVTGVPVDKLPAPIELIVPPPTLITSQLPNRYKFFTIDLSVVRNDEPLGLKSILAGIGAKFASYMSIIIVPAAFTFKLNDTSLDAVAASVGLEWENFEITEIFITNAAGVGTAIINVEYRVD